MLLCGPLKRSESDLVHAQPALGGGRAFEHVAGMPKAGLRGPWRELSQGAVPASLPESGLWASSPTLEPCTRLAWKAGYVPQGRGRAWGATVPRRYLASSPVAALGSRSPGTSTRQRTCALERARLAWQPSSPHRIDLVVQPDALNLSRQNPGSVLHGVSRRVAARWSRALDRMAGTGRASSTQRPARAAAAPGLR